VVLFDIFGITFHFHRHGLPKSKVL